MTPDYSQTPLSSSRTLKQRIMRRIYFIFLLHNTVPLAFDCFVLVVAAFIATLFVSLRDVFANLSLASGAGKLSAFSFSAFSETELETKLLLVVLGVVGYFAVRDLKRAWRAVRVIREKKASPETFNN